MESSLMYRFHYRRTPAAVLILMVVWGIVLSSISSNMCIRYVNVNHSPDVYTVQEVNDFPHDPKALTQSSVRIVALKTGKVKAIHNMDSSYFGEGRTLLGERLFQVTWLTKTGFIYDRNNLSGFETFTHQMKDGWGLATDGKVLFGSNGTSTLYQIDPPDIEREGLVAAGHSVNYGRGFMKSSCTRLTER